MQRPLADAVHHQPGDLGHELVMVKARAIPLEQRELRIVARTRFAIPERLADLKHRFAEHRQHAFHRIFGRGLQKARRADGDAALHQQRFQSRVSDATGAQQWRVNFQHTTGGEKLAYRRQQLRAALQYLQLCSRPPAHAETGGEREFRICWRGSGTHRSGCPREPLLPG